MINFDVRVDLADTVGPHSRPAWAEIVSPIHASNGLARPAFRAAHETCFGSIGV